MSYELKIDPKSRASGRFIGKVRKALVSAALEEKKVSGISQQSIARALGVNRSVINRILRGEANLTLRSLAELAWAMGREPIIEFRKPSQSAGTNQEVSLKAGGRVDTQTHQNSSVTHHYLPRPSTSRARETVG